MFHHLIFSGIRSYSCPRLSSCLSISALFCCFSCLILFTFVILCLSASSLVDVYPHKRQIFLYIQTAFTHCPSAHHRHSSYTLLTMSFRDASLTAHVHTPLARCGSMHRSTLSCTYKARGCLCQNTISSHLSQS